MKSVNIAEAKTHLSALVEQAASGEPVRITRRGKPVAQITSIQSPRKPIDIAALRALTRGNGIQGTGAGELVRSMRDDERY